MCTAQDQLPILSDISEVVLTQSPKDPPSHSLFTLLNVSTAITKLQSSFPPPKLQWIIYLCLLGYVCYLAEGSYKLYFTLQPDLIIAIIRWRQELCVGQRWPSVYKKKKQF